MKNNNKKILIATGGTGGHIFPSLSLSDFLKTKYHIEIVSDKRGLKYLNDNQRINVRTINSGTIFKKNIFKALIGLNKIFFSFLYSIFFMLTSRPNLIIGMGGYSSFPVCLAGYCLGIPILVYENNLVIGRANRFLLPIVKNILVSSKSIQGIDPKYRKKIFFSGYLIRNHILNLKKYEKDLSNKEEFAILIIGGSQSAKVFGEILPEIIIKCFQNKIKFKIYQQCLEEQKKEIEKSYKEFDLKFELFSFTDDLSEFYKKADLAITRSGASSLAELTNLKIPFIAVPLPSSVDNHQLKNANYFKEKGYCFLLDEKLLSVKLFNILSDLNKDKKKLYIMKEKMGEHSDLETAATIEKLIEKILNEKI